MMTHRLDVHPHKVKLCKDPSNCTFQKCWFRHSRKNQIEEDQNEPTKEINYQVFQNAPANLKPPLNNQE